MSRVPRSSSESQHKPGGIWSGILIGMLAGLGGAAAIAVWVSHSNPFVAQPGASSTPANPPTTTTQTATPATPNASGNIVDPATRAAPVDSHYDFYHMLPGPSAPAPTPTGPSPKPDTPAPAPSVWVQVGSFTDNNQADDLKAQLAMLGYEASIQTVDAADKGTLYRVRLGPFSSDAAQQVKNALAQSQIQSTLVSRHDTSAPATTH